jgi:hypothetical protein
VTGPVRPAWPTPWPEVDRAVERLRDGVVEAVGDDLVGLYLNGSLGLGDFDPASSDVDVLVATARALPGVAVERLRRLHGALHAEGGWAARLEVVYLPLATLRRFDPQDTARYPFGASDREFTLGRQGPTWVLDRWVAREHGLVVAGPDPRELIDPIGPGTRALCALEPGQAINVLGPLGNGFDLGVERPLLIAGGGVAASPGRPPRRWPAAPARRWCSSATSAWPTPAASSMCRPRPATASRCRSCSSSTTRSG